VAEGDSTTTDDSCSVRIFDQEKAGATTGRVVFNANTVRTGTLEFAETFVLKSYRDMIKTKSSEPTTIAPRETARRTTKMSLLGAET